MTPSPAARAEALEPWFLEALAQDALIGRLSNRNASDNLYKAADEIRRLQSALDAQARLIEEAREVLQSFVDRKFDTYRETDDGRPVGIQDDNGEKCWIIDHEVVGQIEHLLTTLPAKGGAT